MAKTLQFRRGTTSELSTQTGAVGELFVDTTKDTVVVMDGSTSGGFPLQKELLSGTNIKTINGQSVLGSGDITISSGGSSFSGSYNDLTNKPTIPSSTSQLSNDSGFVTSIKTINGQSLVGSGNLTISGSGAAFDQDLNTTDDVVFNSALVGDVNIIGNTIGAVDSYGNPDTLVVDGNLNVQFGEQGTTTQTVYPYQYGNSGTRFVFQYPGYVFKIENTSTDLSTIDVSPFALGSVIRYNYNGQTLTFTLTSNMTWTGSSWNADVSGDFFPNVGIYGDLTLYGYNFDSVQVTSTINTLVNVLEATETGVAVIGTFTVNGQSSLTGNSLKTINGQSIVGSGNLTIAGGSGSSFDQELNTTDDVVFNSALIGDVSIVGNTIGATDSYGNPDTLIVDGNLNVQFNTITTAPGTITLTNPPQVNYNGSFIQIATGDGWTQQQVEQFSSLSAGTVINFTSGTSSAWGGFSGGRMAVSSVDTSNTSFGVVNLYLSFIELFGYGNVSGNQSYYSMTSWSWTGEVTTGSLATPLSVTETGVDVEGQFTVNGFVLNPNNIQGTLYSGSNIKTINGQSILGSGNLTIAAGSGSSYDQSLNTIDDVVFNSALVGDVSIVGNTIASLDSYGNPDTIVINSDMQVSFGGETVITGNNTVNNITLELYSYAVSFKLPYPSFLMEDFVRALYNNNPDSSPTVTVTFTNASQGILVLTGRLRPASTGWGSGVWGANNTPAGFVKIDFDTNYINDITLNGNPITNLGGYNTEFSVGNQVTFTTGTPVVTTLSVTESGVAIAGDLTLTDNSVTPTNTSTVVKWAKIIVGGQVYYTPLYQ